VRAGLLAALAPLAGDVLLCGLGRDYLAGLLVPNRPALADLVAAAGDDPGACDPCAHPAVRQRLAECLADYNAAHPGNSTAVRRVAFMQAAPDAQRHEISDKGTINQRIAAEHRGDEIDALYAGNPGPAVIDAAGIRS
jgi:feruloyl-CoA synthase